VGLDTKLIRKLNNSLKQLLAVMIVFSIVIPQNLFANPGADGADAPIPESLSNERINFEKVLTPEVAAQLNLQSESAITMHTSSETNGKKIDIDVLQVAFAKKDIKILNQILKKLEPQLRKSYELTPDVKTEINYVGAESDKSISFEAMQAVDFFKGLDKNSTFYKKYVKLSIIEGVKNYFQTLTDPKTKVDYYLTVIRLGGSGGAATFSLWVSGIPTSISGLIGVGVYGGGSAGVGFMIDKYTQWLANNVIDPAKKVRNRLGSIETYMLTAPLLIGLQDTGVFTTEGAAYLAGYMGIATLVQNLYFEMKKRSPKAAMWYKWKATEALFIASGTLLLPMWDVYSINAMDSIISTYKYSSLSTLSQGVWDIFLTNVMTPLLNAAKAKDQSEYRQRTEGKNLKADDIRLYKILHQDELEVRDHFKPFFFGASLVSVFSAIAGTAGHNSGNQNLITTGLVGMLILGGSGFATWWWYAGGPQKLWNNTKTVFRKVVGKIRGKSPEEQSSSLSSDSEIRTCSQLFAM
jgi:hypothetical protein